jgi:hypothetical protein
LISSYAHTGTCLGVGTCAPLPRIRQRPHSFHAIGLETIHSF